MYFHILNETVPDLSFYHHGWSNAVTVLEDWDLAVLLLFLSIKYYNTDHKDLPCVHQCWPHYGHRYPKSVINRIGWIRSNSYPIYMKCQWDEGIAEIAKNPSAWKLFLMFSLQMNWKDPNSESEAMFG